MPTDKELLERVPGIGPTLARRLLTEFGEGSRVARAASNAWGQLTNVTGISRDRAPDLFDELRAAGVFDQLRNRNYTPYLQEAEVIRAGGSGHFMEPEPRPASPAPGWREPTTGLYTGFELNDPNIARQNETGEFVDRGPDEPIPADEQRDMFGTLPTGNRVRDESPSDNAFDAFPEAAAGSSLDESFETELVERGVSPEIQQEPAESASANTIPQGMVDNFAGGREADEAFIQAEQERARGEPETRPDAFFNF